MPAKSDDEITHFMLPTWASFMTGPSLIAPPPGTSVFHHTSSLLAGCHRPSLPRSVGPDNVMAAPGRPSSWCISVR
jgi:hypothetical protein